MNKPVELVSSLEVSPTRSDNSGFGTAALEALESKLRLTCVRVSLLLDVI